MQAGLLDLFWMALSVPSHLNKAQWDEWRYSHTHSWHNKSCTGSMFALSAWHISFAGTAGDIYWWLRGLFAAVVPAVWTKFPSPLMSFDCVCVCVRKADSTSLLFAMLAARKGLMSPTGFNSSKYHHQIDNLMIHIIKTGYKLRTSWVQLVILISRGAELL